MKLAVAQINSFKGDIKNNFIKHLSFVHFAKNLGVELILFPELSITAYEPTLAKNLKIDIDDALFNVFQDVADKDTISIGVGVPIAITDKVFIGTLLFQPFKRREIYTKQFLHADELPYFSPGKSSNLTFGKEVNIGLAICYEVFIDEHAKQSKKNDVKIYMASVAKSESGMDKAYELMPVLARKYGFTILMSNSLGHSDDFIGAGRSAIWSPNGSLLATLDDKNEGILTFDSETEKCEYAYIV